MKIVSMSDPHEAWDRLDVPDGDVLICAGDITFEGRLSEIARFNTWLGTFPHKHKLVIAGNHDLCFDSRYQRKFDSPVSEHRRLFTNATYLQDEEIILDGVKFYGAPHTPEYGDWAFMHKRGAAMKAHWDKIPKDVQVLVTHGPPHGILDTYKSPYFHGEVVCGCEALRDTLPSLKRLRCHIFGHIHACYGYMDIGGVRYINASSCDSSYKPVNRPIVFELNEAEPELAEEIVDGA